MPNRILRLMPALALIVVMAAGCGASSSGERVSRNMDVLTREEIVEANLQSLDVAIERLRPRWLQIRTPPSMSTGGAQIVVFMNAQYQGGPESLSQFGPNDISEIRYLDGPRAAAQLQGYPTTTYVAGGIVMVSPGR